MRNPNFGKPALEIIHGASQRLLLFAEALGHLGHGERSQLREKHPAKDNRAILQAVAILHSVLPEPFDQARDNRAGRVDLFRRELLVFVEALRFHVEHVAVDLIEVEAAGGLEVAVFGVRRDAARRIGGAVKREQKTSSRTNRRLENTDFAETTIGGVSAGIMPEGRFRGVCRDGSRFQPLPWLNIEPAF